MATSGKSSGRHILLEHQYKTSLPYPMANGFAQFCTHSRDTVVVARRLAESTREALRYAAMVAVCDYATSPSADANVLGTLEAKWLREGSLSLDDWLSGLLTVLREIGATWKRLFVGEFESVKTEVLEAACRSLRPVLQTGGPGQDARLSRDFIHRHERDLFAILSELSFLSKYTMCAADVDMPAGSEEDVARQPRRQTLQVYRGSSRRFAECEVTMHSPVAPRKVFIWNTNYTELLMLSPFFIYGRSSGKGDRLGRAEGPKTVQRIRGLMVLDRPDAYAGIDQQTRIAIRLLDYPDPESLQEDIDTVLKPGSEVLFRRRADLGADDKRLFVRRPGDLPKGAEFVGELDTYSIEAEPIGRGAMGVVYVARPKSDAGRLVALKAMTLEAMTVASLVKRFERECRVLVELGKEGNPHLVRFMDAGHQEPYHFLVMEYVEGGSLEDDLRERVSRGDFYSFGEALEIMENICDALKLLHGKGLIHRDIKPGNILLARPAGGRDAAAAKLTDFGLARRMGQQSQSLTLGLGAIGTFEYMAPEQFTDTPSDERADIYALAKILCQMLTGVIPRSADDVQAIDFSRTHPSVPPEGTRQILTTWLSRNPDDRCGGKTAGSTGPVESFLGMLHRAARIEQAGPVLDSLGIGNGDVRAAFGLAGIGHAGARERLLRWCKDIEDPRHAEATIALVNLRDDGVKRIVDELAKTDGLNESRHFAERDALVHSLALALDFHERARPRFTGQKWFRELASGLRRRVRKEFLRMNLAAMRRQFLQAMGWYMVMAGLCAGFSGVFGGPVFGNIHYRTFPAEYGLVGLALSQFVIQPVFGFWLACICPCYLFGICFERPRRYAVIATAGSLVAVSATALYVTTSTIFASGRLLADFGGRAEVLQAILQRYSLVNGAAMMAVVIAYFLVKEMPQAAARRPSAWLSIAAPSLAMISVGALSVPLFEESGFTRSELFGQLLVFACAVLGLGIADYRLDRQLRRTRSDPRAPGHVGQNGRHGNTTVDGVAGPSKQEADAGK